MKKFKYLGAPKDLKPYLEKVIHGEYRFGNIRFPYSPTVLDLGANIGSYTYWILNKYKDARVIAFEPIEENATAYIKNMVASEVPAWNYTLMNAAVYPTESETIKIYLSKVNNGMHSLRRELTNTPDAKYVEVAAIHPRELPECDILKMDIEGAEVNVLESYLKTHKKPAVVSYEFHYFADKIYLEDILGDEYILVSGYVVDPCLGTFTFIHKNYVTFI